MDCLGHCWRCPKRFRLGYCGQAPLVRDLRLAGAKRIAHGVLFPHFGTATGGRRLGRPFLARAARKRRRVLLLLDGWDEVSADLRENIRPGLLAEARDFITLITSRPSGVPQALRDDGGGHVYELAGLSRRAMEDLAWRHFTRGGYPDRLELFLQRLDEQPDLRHLCGNPFLLTLLTRVAAAAPPDHVSLLPRTRAEVYRRAVEWMRQQYNAVRGVRAEFRPDFLTAIEATAYDLLFTSPRPTYTFPGTARRAAPGGGSSRRRPRLTACQPGEPPL